MGFMNYKIEIIGLFFSSLIAITFWRILIVPLGFFIAVVIGIIFFLAYRYIISEEKEVNCYSPFLKFKKILFSCLVVLSVLVVLFVRPISEVEFVAWNVIPLLNLIRLIFSSFLVLFSPSYMILNLLDKNEKLTGTEKVFFSMVLSLFLLPFFGCLSFALASNILQLGIPSIIIINLALLIPYIFLKRNRSKVNEKVSIDLNEKLVLLALLIFISTLMFSKYSLNLTWDYGDLDQYYGYSVSFTKDILPLSLIGPGLDYPFWPFIFLAECFVLSGISYVNAFQFVSIPITFLPILSFYIMVSAFFKRSRHRKIPIIASLFGFFGGGFGWIFGVRLLSNNQTVQSLYALFDVMARTNSGYLVPSFYSAPGITGIYPLYTYALTSIFALIWLIYSERSIEFGNLRYVFIPVMIALGFLAHIAEIAFFIFIFLASILIVKRENVSSYRKCAVSIIFGLLLIALPDIIIGGSYYTEGSAFAYYEFSLYYGTIALVTLAFFLSFIKGHLKTPVVNLKISHNKIRSLKIACSVFIIYFYGLCLIIWSKVFETYNRLPTQMHMVPWYAWLNRLGICGLIALPGIIYLIHKNKNIKDYSFFVFLIPVSFIIARILHVVPSFYFEDRITFFIMISAVILASFVVLKFGQSLKKYVGNNVENIALGSTLSAILVLGLLPGILTNEAVDFNYWSAGEKLSNSELDALNFLRLNTPSNCSVLTLTTRSNHLLSYAGLFPVQTYVNRDPSIIFNPLFPETAIYSIMKSQVKYLFLTLDDQKELDQNPSYSGFITNSLNNLLIAFQNNEVTIYTIPIFSIPTNSNTALVMPRAIAHESDNGTARACAWSIVPLARIKYSTVSEDDPARFNFSTLILPHDLNLWNEVNRYDFQKYMEWINQGGQLIVFDNPISMSNGENRNTAFTDLLTINAKKTMEADGIKSKTNYVEFPSTIKVPMIYSDDNNVKIISYYIKNNTSISPYALTKKIGKGEIVYLVISPYVSALEYSTGNLRRNYYEKMSSILNMLDLRCFNRTLIKWTDFPQFDFIKEPINFTGKIVVDTDYIQLSKLNVNRIATFSSNGMTETMYLNNSIIEDLKYDGPVKFRINGSEIYSSGISLGTYSNIKIIGDFSLTIEISKNNTVKISMWGDGTLLNETFQDCVIQLSFKNNHIASVLVKTPTITTEGDTFFNRARIYRNYYNMPLFYDDGTEPFQVIGKTTFKIKYSDNGIIFIENFIFNGKWFYPMTEQKQPSFTEIDIPWFSVLTSSFHILLVTTMSIFLITYAYLTLKRRKIRIHLKFR
jgi:hypothetical protein